MRHFTSIIIITTLLLILLVSCSENKNNINSQVFNLNNELTNTQYISFKNNANIDFNKYSLLGFNNDIYLGEVNDDKFDIYTYSLDGEFDNEVLIDNYDFYNNFTYNDGIIIIASKLVETGIKFDIYTLEYNTDSFNKIYSNIANRIPYVSVLDNEVIVNYRYLENDKLNSFVDKINLLDNSVEVIVKESAKVTKKGTVKGKVIICAGGYEDNTYYQILNCDDEAIENVQKKYIYSYDSNTRKHKKELKLKNQLIHFNGNTNFILTSEYNSQKPIIDSGVIYYNNDKTIIPNVMSGEDILEWKVIDENNIVFITKNNIYNYDIQNNEYNIKPTNGNIRSIIYKNGALTLQNNNTLVYQYLNSTDKLVINKKITNVNYNYDKEKGVINKISNEYLGNYNIQIVGIKNKKLPFKEVEIYMFNDIVNNNQKNYNLLTVEYILTYKDNKEYPKIEGFNTSELILDNEYKIVGKTPYGG